MAKVNVNSVTVLAYTETGEFIGEYVNITEAAKANKTSPTSVTTAVFFKKDHFTVGRFWIQKTDSLEEAMAEHKRVKESKTKKKISYIKKRKERIIRIPNDERKGDFVFVKSNLQGVECCRRCAVYFEEKCLPCRAEDGHENGYWRYSKPLEP